jgi:excisionase family DNA binding protein
MATLAAARPLLTIGETAEKLSISETTVRRLIGAGILPAVRVSPGAIRVEAGELDEWLEERRTLNDVSEGDGSRQGQLRAGADPAERNGTSNEREEVEPAQLAGN